MLNRNKSNMYEFVETKNFIGGECPHKCQYCYVNAMKRRNSAIARKYTGEPFLCENEFGKGFGSGKTWFVGSMIDMWAESIPSLFIHKVLSHCFDYDKNVYFFQSKNPRRFLDFRFPDRTILCMTAETNRIYRGTSAPSVGNRLKYIEMAGIEKGVRIHITIEPIMDFDLEEFVAMIKAVDPWQVNIGADSKRNNLFEPGLDKIGNLIGELEKFTRVYLKDNLKRLYNK